LNCYSSISYDGSCFHGFPKQPDESTVQGDLEAKLQEYFQQEVRVSCLSRTDRSVHAFDQRIQFKVQTPVPAKKIPAVMNHKLSSIRFNWVRQVEEEFLLNSLQVTKQYWYRILWEEPYPFLTPYAWCPEYPKPNLQRFAQALTLYEGIHDFEMLSKRDRCRRIVDFQREIYSCKVEESGSEWLISLEGSGFLWEMVRHMIAYALASSRESLSLEELSRLLEGKGKYGKPKPSIRPAPGTGLYLREVQVMAPDQEPQEIG